jgi:nitrogen regulatory protein PII 1
MQENTSVKEGFKMKMIQAIVRPEKLKDIEDGLKKEGFFSLSEMSIRGRGKQKGIVIGSMQYDKLPKELLVIACKDEDLKKIIDIIVKEARTGNIGDGKIFVLPVEDAITIRTRESGESSL